MKKVTKTEFVQALQTIQKALEEQITDGPLSEGASIEVRADDIDLIDGDASVLLDNANATQVATELYQ